MFSSAGHHQLEYARSCRGNLRQDTCFDVDEPSYSEPAAAVDMAEFEAIGYDFCLSEVKR